MIRFRWYYDKEKETIWLNQMAHEGWAMVHFFWDFTGLSDAVQENICIRLICFFNWLQRIVALSVRQSM